MGVWFLVLFSCVPVGLEVIEVAGLDVAGDASATPAPHCTQSQVSGVPWGAGYFEECLAKVRC